MLLPLSTSPPSANEGFGSPAGRVLLSAQLGHKRAQRGWWKPFVNALPLFSHHLHLPPSLPDPPPSLLTVSTAHNAVSNDSGVHH